MARYRARNNSGNGSRMNRDASRSIRLMLPYDLVGLVAFFFFPICWPVCRSQVAPCCSRCDDDDDDDVSAVEIPNNIRIVGEHGGIR